MRAYLAIALVAVTLASSPLALAGCSASSSTSWRTSATSLRVTYWEDTSARAVTWTLRCNPPGGSLKRPATACHRLASGGSKLFAPLPKHSVCTDIYGGPQKARIVGVLAGKRIWATFTRTNGCEIGRWNRFSPWLLPPGSVTS